MYLSKLTSNKDSFRDLEFENGRINIILGKKTTKEKNKTVIRFKEIRIIEMR